MPREQGCQIIARTYRAWLSGSRPAARIHDDALVIDARRATIGQPDSLYGRRKMAVRLRRRGLPVTHCTVDRLMRELGMNSVRRARVVRTTVLGKNGRAPVTCSTVTLPPRRLAQPFALVVDSHARSGSRNPNGAQNAVQVLVRRHRHSVGHQPTGPGQDLQRDGGPVQVQTYACRRDGVPHSLLAQWRLPMPSVQQRKVGVISRT